MPVVRTLRSGIRRTGVALAVGASTLALAACGISAPSSSSGPSTARAGGTTTITMPSAAAQGTTTNRGREDASPDADEANERIELHDAPPSRADTGAQTSVVPITSAGTHHVRGSLGDGVLQVHAATGEAIHLILEGVSVLSSDGPALSATGPGDIIVELAHGTTNALLSVTGDAISAAGDLLVTGPGSLVVTAMSGHGITGRGEVVLDADRLSISAGGDAVQGQDAVRVVGGEIDAVAGGDAFRSPVHRAPDEDGTSGLVEILGGRIHVSSDSPSRFPSDDGPGGPTGRTLDIGHTTAPDRPALPLEADAVA
jgi:hypothetical protein